MSHLITNENVPFMPRKLVDSELALWDASGIPKGGRLTVNKETGINGAFSSANI